MDAKYLDPRSWPSPLQFIAAFMVLRYGWILCKRWRRSVARSWPLVAGRIESVDVKAVSGGKSAARYKAKIDYSYNADDARDSGVFERVFADEDEAGEYVRDVVGRAISVHVNPNNPRKSFLNEESLQLAHHARPAVPENARQSPLPETGVRKAVSVLFAIFSLVGVIVSLFAHIGAWLGRVVLPQGFFFGLHIGIFVVFIPAVLLHKQSAFMKGSWWKKKPFSDHWLLPLIRVTLYYALANFALFALQQMSLPSHDQTGPPSPLVWRGFSGHWIIFYLFSFAVHYTSAFGVSSHCPHGHPIADGTTACPSCHSNIG